MPVNLTLREGMANFHSNAVQVAGVCIELIFDKLL
jgi:hypothetical protein